MNGLLHTLRSLGAVRLATIGLVAAAMIAFFGFVTTRIATPAFALLYSDLELRDSGPIVQKLEAMGVPYQIRGDGGQVLVPADQVARLRMTMAEAGLPHGGSIGYELFDKTDALGTSSLVQNVNHVRALEGELARSISSINSVRQARVHLVLPRREMFSRERQEPSASIIVTMRGAERPSKQQVAAIQNLVASAVPGLKVSRVSVVDSEGNLLARGDNDDGDAAVANTAEERRVEYENRLSRKAEEMLERTVGQGKARVEVHADMDFDRVTTNSKTFDPDQQVARSTQSVTESSDSSESGDQPVTVQTNLPNPQTAPANAGGRSKNARTEETVNNEIGETTRTQVHETGVVHRLSVAVLVDGSYAAAADGSKTYQPRSPEELKQLTAMVRSAVGFDEKRGDTIELANLRFSTPEEIAAGPPATTIMGFERADILKLGEMLVIAIVAVLFILLVVRPLLMRVIESTAAASPQMLQSHGTGAPALPAPAGLTPALTGDSGGGMMAIGNSNAGGAPESMIDINQVEGRVAASSIRKIGEIVDKHPDEAVAIVRAWMYQGA